MAAPSAGGPPVTRSWFWAQGLACGLLVATAAPLAMVLAVLFAPAALVALMSPPATAAHRQMGGILLVYGMAAALPWLQQLWAGAQSWPVSLDLLSAMRLLPSCWGAQAAAWLAGELVPFVARQILEARVRLRVNRLRDARSRLVAEWGLEEEAE
ncbi:MAG: hypothetical protein IT555_03620 [Acetobacteraceae bacterium]|nr:hypothetical protein [Acetobacteraceae bacterium]